MNDCTAELAHVERDEHRREVQRIVGMELHGIAGGAGHSTTAGPGVVLYDEHGMFEYAIEALPPKPYMDRLYDRPPGVLSELDLAGEQS